MDVPQREPTPPTATLTPPLLLVDHCTPPTVPYKRRQTKTLHSSSKRFAKKSQKETTFPTSFSQKDDVVEIGPSPRTYIGSSPLSPPAQEPEMNAPETVEMQKPILLTSPILNPFPEGIIVTPQNLL